MQVRNYVVIPFLGKYDMTANLVEQLLEQGDTTAIFLCDNGTTPEPLLPWGHSPRVLTFSCAKWNLHRMWNFGVTQACRYEFDVEISEHGTHDPWPIPVIANVAVLNNDLELVSDHYIGALGDALRADGSLALVSGTEDTFTDDLGPYHYAHFESGIQGNAMMLKAELPFRFDERFEWWYGDNDFAAQCENAGYALAVVHDARHVHLGGGSVTTKALPDAELAEYHLGTGALPREYLFR